jgi:hypothetical protein
LTQSPETAHGSTCRYCIRISRHNRQYQRNDDRDAKGAAEHNGAIDVAWKSFLFQGQPQRQLAIRTDVTVDEVFQLGRHVAPFKAEAAQDFLREAPHWTRVDCRERGRVLD